MKKEWLMLVTVVTVTLVMAIGLIRWFAPQLLGIPIDLQTVQVSDSVPPFYENIFRKEDYNSTKFILKDPYTNVRAKPLLYDLSGLGPHDILGFRNHRVPNVADVVVIGDSQTYGNNVYLSENWPSQLAARLAGKQATVYSMATGGWGAVQYLEMLRHATVFLPRVVIVAFYTGNDPHESLSMAYSQKRLASLRPDIDVDLEEHPPNVGFPPPPSELWEVRFRDGLTTTFSPSLRLISNDTEYATVRAGYEVMLKAAQLMVRTASQANIELLFTIIPTKELVYAEKIQRDGIHPIPDYEKLVKLEKDNIANLVEAFHKFSRVKYVDLVKPLQAAAMKKTPLYPSGMNGHPLVAGYGEIANALAPAVRRFLPDPVWGLVAIKNVEQNIQPLLIGKHGMWNFVSEEVLTGNGWSLENMRVVRLRDVAKLPLLGTIDKIDRVRFGPEAVR